MIIACQSCGSEFEAKRAHAKYCSEKCKKRAQRAVPKAEQRKAATAVVGRLMDHDGHDSSEPPAEGRLIVDETPMTVHQATLDELRKAGKLGTVAGQSALALARRIDNPALDTGSALAGMVKQLEATLAGVLADKEDAGDELDELRRRREERRRAAG
ncbi:hypothetical protein [Micrococcus lylae]|uniref:Terminase small subunit n=1 Tax=Micrococcus lylae TaxID=1273 RepID=A0ABY2K6T0_9MICC|nr:hypothetical protein [Micrococcus lylae]TFI01643.1 hypothetical protein E4A49_01090 [Micrococcus lylae]